MKKLLVTVLAVGLMATITACGEEKKETKKASYDFYRARMESFGFRKFPVLVE